MKTSCSTHSHTWGGGGTTHSPLCVCVVCDLEKVLFFGCARRAPPKRLRFFRPPPPPPPPTHANAGTHASMSMQDNTCSGRPRKAAAGLALGAAGIARARSGRMRGGDSCVAVRVRRRAGGPSQRASDAAARRPLKSFIERQPSHTGTTQIFCCLDSNSDQPTTLAPNQSKTKPWLLQGSSLSRGQRVDSHTTRTRRERDVEAEEE